MRECAAGQIFYKTKCAEGKTRIQKKNPVKQLDYFLRSNKININHLSKRSSALGPPGFEPWNPFVLRLDFGLLARFIFCRFNLFSHPLHLRFPHSG